ncbi:MAG: hypothetical protein RLZZ267_528 [Bacillota bacterium]|jgi:hypothetical protein
MHAISPKNSRFLRFVEVMRAISPKNSRFRDGGICGKINGNLYRELEDKHALV